jgi:putative oxidoreductase
MAASQTLKNALAWAGRLVLGGTFAYAAILKLADPAAFATDIGHYRLLSYPLTLAVAVYLPWLELLCALAVLMRRRERGALVLLFGLCGVFSLALASAWWRGLDISCGCFGSGTASAIPLALARSVALGLVAFFLLRQSLQADACIGKREPVQ